MSVFESLPKDVSETRKLTFDFVGKMASGVTISSSAASQAVYTGATSTLTLGSTSNSGTQVTLTAAGGTAGVIYQVTVAATLSDGQILRQATLLPVLPDAL